jgi:hypothetical protein
MSEKLFVTIDGKKREMNEAELAQWAIDLANWQEQEMERLALEQAKADKELAASSAMAKLEALGLTADEIAAITS